MKAFAVGTVIAGLALAGWSMRDMNFSSGPEVTFALMAVCLCALFAWAAIGTPSLRIGVYALAPVARFFAALLLDRSHLPIFTFGILLIVLAPIVMHVEAHVRRSKVPRAIAKPIGKIAIESVEEPRIPS